MSGEKLSIWEQIAGGKTDGNPIFMTVVDSSVMEVAINQYLTSYRRLKIPNFLFVCTDDTSATFLKSLGIDCLSYESNIPSSLSTPNNVSGLFIREYVKIKVATDILKLGNSVIFTDVDVILFKDPTDYLVDLEDDFILLNDEGEENSAFYIATPNQAAIELHETALSHILSKGLEQQQEKNSRFIDTLVMASKQRISEGSELKKSTLDSDLFPTAVIYFELERRMFTSDKSCMVEKCKAFLVLNNNMNSTEAKVYRLREVGLWKYDQSSYFTNKEEKFILFGNPDDFGNETRDYEQKSLRAALAIGATLKRKVILPKFHCYGCDSNACKLADNHCALNAQFHVQTLFLSFPNQFREHTYLKSSLVPRTVKNSLSPEIFLRIVPGKQPHIYLSRTQAFAIISDELEYDQLSEWFGLGPLSKYSVLKFHSLYVNVNTNDDNLDKDIEEALYWSDYRQTIRQKQPPSNIL